MSAIDKLTSKSKMALEDYKLKDNTINTSTPFEVKTETLQNALEVKKDKTLKENALTEKNENEPKTKTTIYLKHISKKHLDEMYAKRILSGNKTDISELLSEAIEALYAKENANHNA